MTIDINNRCGKVLAQMREAHGLGVRDVARRAKLSPSTVSRAEAGEGLRIETFCAIARAIGVRPGAIIDQIVGAS